ncbi:Lysosomal thiol, partial [Perkinsus olseni]
YSCQHGELECTINRFQGCVIKKGGGNQLQTFKAIYNEEVDIHKGSNKWNTTANEGLPQLHEVYACRDGDESWDIVAEFAKETGELRPPHGYTPWSTIDGIPFDFYGKKSFKETVCDAIEKRGGHCPDRPVSQSLRANSLERLLYGYRSLRALL